MKKVKRFLKDLFGPQEFNDLDTEAIGSAFNDLGVRTLWLNYCFEEIKRINQEVDSRLLTGSMYGITDLCARRKAYQDVLDAVLVARRQVTQAGNHNPRSETLINLDRVTV